MEKKKRNIIICTAVAVICVACTAGIVAFEHNKASKAAELLSVSASETAPESTAEESTAPPVVYAQSLTLSESEVKLKVGEKKELNFVLLPENATDQSVNWLSENSKIAAVNENGKITAKGVGKTNIVAESADGKVKAVCAVEVLEIEVEKVSFSDSSAEIKGGEMFILNSYIEPKNATYKKLDWSTSDSSVAVYKDGVVTAKGNGRATITAKAKNGKSAQFEITVSDKGADKIMYTTVNLNLRSGASSSSKSLVVLPVGTEVSVVSDYKWAMVNAKGRVGYVNREYLSSVKPVRINNVPYLNQLELKYPTGCEPVSAAMVLRYYGYDVSASAVVDSTPTGDGLYQENGKWIAADPFEYFVGHPSQKKNEGAYGCFSKPIVTAMQEFAGDRVKNVSGCSFDELLSFVEDGKPVVVWGVRAGNPVKSGRTWTFPDGSGTFTEQSGEHCMVLIGYDSKNVYLNDPVAGAGVTQSISSFKRNWLELHSQAIIIE